MPLELLVLERGHPPAPVADGVVVMLPAWNDALESRHALAELNALDQPHVMEELQGPVDARDADVAARVVKLSRDLVRREAAILPAEQGDHRPAGSAGPVATVLQRCARRPFPLGCRPVSHGRQATS